MKFGLFLLLSFFSSFALADFIAEYPQKPDPQATPGSLCHQPDTYRYSENIPYCNRDVSSQLKKVIFEEYRARGYRLDLSNRSNYKIDHYIPLCAGGSNEEDNLWPQHISVFQITDPLEAVGCEKLKDGLITQAALIRLIKQAKNNLSSAPGIIRQLQNL